MVPIRERRCGESNGLRDPSGPPRVIELLVLSGVRLQREGLAALIGGAVGLRIAAVGATVDEALWRSPCDVAVVDASLPDAPAEIRRLACSIGAPIVAFGVADDDRHIIELAEAGVLGFVGREATLNELVAAVRSAACGEASVPPRVATALLQRISAPAPRMLSADVASLTVRERQIVQIIAEGLTNKEIAARLSIEVATVKNHVHNILEKLQVSRRTEAVARLRLVEPGSSDDLARALEPAERAPVGSKAI